MAQQSWLQGTASCRTVCIPPQASSWAEADGPEQRGARFQHLTVQFTARPPPCVAELLIACYAAEGVLMDMRACLCQPPTPVPVKQTYAQLCKRHNLVLAHAAMRCFMTAAACGMDSITTVLAGKALWISRLAGRPCRTCSTGAKHSRAGCLHLSPCLITRPAPALSKPQQTCWPAQLQQPCKQLGCIGGCRKPTAPQGVLAPMWELTGGS